MDMIFLIRRYESIKRHNRLIKTKIYKFIADTALEFRGMIYLRRK